ncbi:MAG: chromosome segregation protein, partial [Sphingomicrobium sp.]
LVSQGRIGSVIAAKPTERRQMLEEAAGISGLHARRKDAEQKLRATEANLARLGEILAEQDARAGALRRQARAAERYRQLSDKIRSVEARLVHARWAEADHAADSANREAAAAGEEVTTFQTVVADALGTLEQANQLLGQRRRELGEARDAALNLAHQLASARAQRDAVVRRLEELVRLDQSLAADIAREEELQGDAARAIAQLDEERGLIEQRLVDAEAIATRISTDLGQAEAKSREAEAALAELLARQAAMRAERRVGEAALEAAQAQVARTDYERQRLVDQLDELGDGSDQAEARDAANRGAEAAAQALAEADSRRVEAEHGRATAAGRRDAAESGLAAARATCAAARSEHDALARALDQGGGGAIASLAAEPGYERALAAALGEDMDAAIGGDGPRRWQGSAAAPGDPRLADGLVPLTDYVRAPLELARRLRQIGVCDVDQGQALGVGQRLVTRDGQLRRWDGFVSVGGGAAAAERLIRSNRLAELERELPALDLALTGAAQERDSAVEQVDHFRTLGEQARLAATAAEQAARDAVRAGDSAAAALERLEAQRTALGQRLSDLAPVVEAAAEALSAAQQALANLADPAALEQELEGAREAAGKAAEAVADKRAEAATRARESAADRERVGAASRDQSDWRKRQSDAEQRLLQAVERQRSQAAERAALADDPDRQGREIAELEQAIAGNQSAVGTAAGAEQQAERGVAEAADVVARGSEGLTAARETRAAASARAEAQQARSAEYARICVERFECVPQRLPEKLGFAPDEVRDPDVESFQLERLTAERERLGPVNLVAEQELAEIDASRTSGVAEAEELTQAIHRLRGSIGSLNREGRVRLLAAYEKVDAHFRSLFRTLFDGGQAHLELVESDDPLEAGLEIMAQPPGKRLSALTLLSGGEQALTAIALIFALFLTNPAPICVLDEVDAPLDDANVERFCDLLERMTQETDTRYLIVTHNAVTMSRMHRLYGVTMIEKGISRLVSVDLSAATLLAAE